MCGADGCRAEDSGGDSDTAEYYSDSDGDDGDDPGATIGSTVNSRHDWRADTRHYSTGGGGGDRDALSLPLLTQLPEENDHDPSGDGSPRLWFLLNRHHTHISTSSGHESFVHTCASSSRVQLGLGDLIFYSVVVGRAAMYDAVRSRVCVVSPDYRHK